MAPSGPLWVVFRNLKIKGSQFIQSVYPRRAENSKPNHAF